MNTTTVNQILEIVEFIRDNAATKEDLAQTEQRLDTEINKNRQAITKNGQEITKNREAITKNGQEITKNREAITKNREAITKNGQEIAKNRNIITKNGQEITKNRKAITKNGKEIISLEQMILNLDTKTDRIEQKFQDGLFEFKTEISTQIDGFANLYKTSEIEFLALRAKHDRLELHIKQIAKHVRLELK